MVHGTIFKTLKRTLTASQTIERTEVGGFNQFFDDPEGTKAWRYGIGVNHFLSKNTNMGLEFSRRELGYHINLLILIQEKSAKKSAKPVGMKH